MNHWNSNKSRMFVILLQHCTKNLTQSLKSNGRYEAMNYSKDVISLITIIRYVAHPHDDTTEVTMDLLTSNLALYTKFMTSEDDIEAFYGKFNTMADTINVHGGSSRYHTQLYAYHLAILCVEKILNTTTISKVKLEKVQKDAKNSACEEYLSCLFILVADSCRFQGIKRALDNQFYWIRIRILPPYLRP